MDEDDDNNQLVIDEENILDVVKKHGENECERMHLPEDQQPLTKIEKRGRQVKSDVLPKTAPGRRKSACGYCGKFVNTNQLTVHCYVHHFGWRYQCTICQSMFTLKTSCFRHMEQQHRIVAADLKKNLEFIRIQSDEYDSCWANYCQTKNDDADKSFEEGNTVLMENREDLIENEQPIVCNTTLNSETLSNEQSTIKNNKKNRSNKLESKSATVDTKSSSLSSDRRSRRLQLKIKEIKEQTDFKLKASPVKNKKIKDNVAKHKKNEISLTMVDEFKEIGTKQKQKVGIVNNEEDSNDSSVLLTSFLSPKSSAVNVEGIASDDLILNKPKRRTTGNKRFQPTTGFNHIDNANDDHNCKTVKNVRQLCSFCKKMFNVRYILQHTYVAHFGWRYRCEICQDLCMSKGAIMLHLTSIHSAEIPEGAENYFQLIRLQSANYNTNWTNYCQSNNVDLVQPPTFEEHKLDDFHTVPTYTDGFSKKMKLSNGVVASTNANSIDFTKKSLLNDVPKSRRTIPFQRSEKMGLLSNVTSHSSNGSPPKKRGRPRLRSVDSLVKVEPPKAVSSAENCISVIDLSQQKKAHQQSKKNIIKNASYGAQIDDDNVPLSTFISPKESPSAPSKRHRIANFTDGFRKSETNCLNGSPKRRAVIGNKLANFANNSKKNDQTDRKLCKYCNCLVLSKHLNRHMYFMHFGWRYRCTLCQMLFKARSSLLRHVERHHDNSINSTTMVDENAMELVRLESDAYNTNWEDFRRNYTVYNGSKLPALLCTDKDRPAVSGAKMKTKESSETVSLSSSSDDDNKSSPLNVNGDILTLPKQTGTTTASLNDTKRVRRVKSVKTLETTDGLKVKFNF